MYNRSPFLYICPVTNQSMQTTYDRLRAHLATVDNKDSLNAAIRLIQRRRLEGALTKKELYSLLDFVFKKPNQ